MYGERAHFLFLCAWDPKFTQTDGCMRAVLWRRLNSSKNTFTQPLTLHKQGLSTVALYRVYAPNATFHLRKSTHTHVVYHLIPLLLLHKHWTITFHYQMSCVCFFNKWHIHSPLYSDPRGACLCSLAPTVCPPPLRDRGTEGTSPNPNPNLFF